MPAPIPEHTKQAILADIRAGQKSRAQIARDHGVSVGSVTRHDVTTRRAQLLALARDRRGTATEVARWLTWLGIPTTPAVVRGLAHRGRVIAGGDGRYRLGDVEALRREAAS